MKNENLQTIAANLLEQAKTKTRDNGETFIFWEGKAKEILQPAIYAAHDDGEYMPDDWIYRDIEKALQILSECDNQADLPNYVDSAVDIYTHDLKEWAANHPMAIEYIDRALESGESEFIPATMAAQYERLSDVVYILARELEQ